MLLNLLLCILYISRIAGQAREYMPANNLHIRRPTHEAQHSEFLKTQATTQQDQHSVLLQQEFQQQAPAPKVYKNDYFFFSSPDDKANETDDFKYRLSNIMKRRQVIFIKSPVNDAYENYLLDLIKNSLQQKTHVFIFRKEPDYADFEYKLQELEKNVEKPEIHFIKYHNALEDQRIQSSIIEEYEDTNDKKSVNYDLLESANAPVSKSYAMKFLPTDVDVVPGSSYIPLVFR